MNLKFKILSLFPEAFENLQGLIQVARDQKIFSVETVPLREFGIGRHKKVDDQVFGGADGMLLSPQVLSDALDSMKQEPGFEHAKVFALSPKGRVWNQNLAQEWSKDPSPKILICGRYAGFDQRFIDTCCDGEISIGDFILNGGEVAALAILESVVRLLPGVLHNADSPSEDSFSGGSHLLEAPQFTRPRNWNSLEIPAILVSGHHENIESWKQASAIIETYLKRPDLIKSEDLTQLKKLMRKPSLKESIIDTYGDNKLKSLLKSLEKL